MELLLGSSPLSAKGYTENISYVDGDSVVSSFVKLIMDLREIFYSPLRDSAHEGHPHNAAHSW